MLTSIDVKFIFDIARLSASLGDKGLFSSANILQIVDVVRRVVFLLFMLCFSQKFAYFLLVKGVKSLSFCITSKTIQLRPQVFLVNGLIICQFCCTIDDISLISQNSSKFGQQ